MILEVDGTAVADPRDVMAALRDQPADARVTVAYLRDRSRTTGEVTVPEQRRLRLPAPPAPPAVPEPPPHAPKPPRPPLPG